MTITKTEADGMLAAAITAHAEAYGLSRADDMLNHYAVIAHWLQPTDDGKSNYSLHFHQETVPEHITEGLFRVAAEIVKSQAWAEDTD